MLSQHRRSNLDLASLRGLLAAKGSKNAFAASVALTAADGRLLWTPEFDHVDYSGPMPEDPAYPKLRSTAWMLNSVSDAAEYYILDVAFRGATALSSLYGGLYNDTPIDTDTEATLTGEPSGFGYARVEWECNGTDFPSLVQDGNGDYTIIGIEGLYTASGGDIGPFTYFVLQESSSGTAGDIYSYMLFAGGPLTISDTETLRVTPVLAAS